MHSNELDLGGCESPPKEVSRTVRPRGTVEYRFHDGKIEWRNLADDEQHWIESTYSVELVEKLHDLIHPKPRGWVVLSAQNIADINEAAQTIATGSLGHAREGLSKRLHDLAEAAERWGEGQ